MLGHALLKGVAKWMLYIKFHYKEFDQGVAKIWQPMQNKLSLESTSCCSQSEVMLPDLEGVKELDLHLQPFPKPYLQKSSNLCKRT